MAAERAEAAAQRAADERAAERAKLKAAAAAELAAEYERATEEARQLRGWWEGWEAAAKHQRSVESSWLSARINYNEAAEFWRAVELSTMTEDEARAEKKQEAYNRCISVGHSDNVCVQIRPDGIDRDHAEEARSSAMWSVAGAERAERLAAEMVERIAAETAERAAERE